MLEREDVLKLAKLSRLEVAEGDIDSVKGHLDKMLDHMEALKALSAKTCPCRDSPWTRLLRTPRRSRTTILPSRR